MLGDVEIWNAEEHYLAIFGDEGSMRAGGRGASRRVGQ